MEFCVFVVFCFMFLWYFTLCFCGNLFYVFAVFFVLPFFITLGRREYEHLQCGNDIKPT